MMKKEEKIDLGSVKVHKKVFAAIIAAALKEVDGVHLVEENLGNKLAKLFGQNEFPGIDIKVDENREVNLDLQVLVRYGMNIPDVARQVQLAVDKGCSRRLHHVAGNRGKYQTFHLTCRNA